MSSRVEILLGNGDGTFQAPTSISVPYPYDAGSITIAAADLRADGINDLLVGSSYGFVLVYLGDGKGGFEQLPPQITFLHAWQLAPA